MRELIVILGWLAIIVLKAFIDWILFKTGKKIQHGFEMMVVVVIAFVWLGLVAGVSKQEELPYALEVIAFMWGAWGFWFDGLYNWFTGEHWFHYGKTSLIDRFFQKWGLGAYLMYKVFALILMGFGIKFIFEDLKFNI